jgi:DNA-binding transcriptional LysR family regulator
LAVDLRHLRYAVAAADGGSFRRAARAMNVQESAINWGIRDLEEEIDAALQEDSEAKRIAVA